MSKIKSALEIAMERTAGVPVDKEALRRDELIKNGKTLAARFLEKPQEVSFNDEISRYAKDEIAWLKQGIVQTLLANLTLIRYETDMARIEVTTKGIMEIANKKSDKRNLEYILNQFQQLLKQYIENVEQLTETLRMQWEPQLKKKAEMLKQQTGQAIELTAEQDPQFAQTLAEQISRLDAQYNEVLNKGKTEIKRLI